MTAGLGAKYACAHTLQGPTEGEKA